jgi:hypothetical protein
MHPLLKEYQLQTHGPEQSVVCPRAGTAEAQ